MSVTDALRELVGACFMQTYRQIKTFAFSGEADYHSSDACHYIYSIVLTQ